MPSVDVLPFRSSDSDHLARILISLDHMSSPFGSKEGDKGGGDEKSPPQRGSNSSSLQDALTTQDFFASAFKSILESSDKKAKDRPASSPFQSHSSVKEEDLIKILASSDSVSAFRTAGSLLKQLSQKDNNESLRKKPSLLRSTSETLLSKESLANALASGDWALLRQLSASKPDIPEKTPSGLKRKASDAFSSKDSISDLFASADLALLRQLSSASKENPEILPNRTRSGSDVFGSRDSIANALASGDWALLRQLSTSAKAAEGSSETNKTGSSKGGALSASSIASKDVLQTLANAFSSDDWSKEYKRQHVDIEYAPKDVFEAEKSGSGRRQNPHAPSPPKLSPKESTKSSWLNGYYKDVAEAKPKAAPPTKQKPLSPLPTKAKTNVVSTPSTATKAKTKTKTSNPSAKNPKSTRHSRREPSLKIYVEPADADVLFGRGGKSNNHPGNKGYRDELEKLKPIYKTSDKSEKTELAQLLIDTIQDKQGGRFLQRDDDGRYYQVDNVVARRKASQALREENTPESRQAKRAKYGKN